METKELNIIPISMRCTQEQYKSIKPILDANGISNDFVFSYADTFLVTNYSDDIVVMNTLSIDAEKFGRTLFTEWDEKIFLKCLGIETKELKVGDYIRGFKYDCAKDLEEGMNSHVGDIGIIIQKVSGLIKVKFEDNSTWYYPHDLAIEHLVDKYIKVGDYIRGFKIDYGYPRYEELDGKIGQVIEVSNNNQIKVRFNNCEMYYPKHIAIDHLCNEDMEMFEKGKDANAKMFNEINKTEIEDKLNKCKREVKAPLQDTPFHKPDFSHLKDNINPSHYKRLPKETIERIGDNLTPEEFKGYLKGNILKYLDRYENKNGVEDLKKANWYLNKLIEIENEK